MKELNNSIQEGSSIPRTLEIDEIGLEYFDIPIERNILLIEGEDDEIVIDMYYRLLSKTPPFELRRVSMLNENISYDGKRNTLDYYNSKKNDPNFSLKLLIDRDYDFILNENLEDDNVFYYDYFELENYLFDDEIFEQFLICSFPKKQRHDLKETIKKIEEFSINDNYMNLYFLNAFRELHYREKTVIKLTNPNKYASFCSSINIESIITGKNPNANGQSIDERIFEYLSFSLNDLQQNLFPNLIFEVKSQCQLPTNILELFKFYYKGKTISKSVESIISDILNLKMKCIGSIREMLYRQWIPRSSVFKQKLEAVEESFSAI